MEAMVLAAILTALVSLSSALTDEQLASFMTSDMIEINTGLMGSITIETTDGFHHITSNGVPDHLTPEYPRRGNPNDIVLQDHVWTIPVNPVVGTSNVPLQLGPIGVAINGIPFFNPYTNTGEDAVETETFDNCDGHPTMAGVYHYHKQPSSCVFSIVEGEPSSIIGVALDGFPIYGPIDENGNTLTSDDLDECHGRYVNGKYRYHTTADFPYIMGCYKGAYAQTLRPLPGEGGGQNPGDGSEDDTGDTTIVSNDGGNGQTSLKSAKSLTVFALLTALFYIHRLM
ncbi:uncharacterized protein [Asterias amurensis]|uniref:uncharacterized protein n=1 Tax=Asterias amurensis TaxID=7602 RepID=UPI003AB45BBA